MSRLPVAGRWNSEIPKNRASGSVLVADGGEVKLRLLAERHESKSVVHVDWVRFTTLLRNAPAPDAELLFPKSISTSIWDEPTRVAQFERILAELPAFEWSPSAQAFELASKVALSLGEGFIVAAEMRKGMDFYKFRWSIELNGSECGWVGFLSSSDSPRQQSQSKTIHANIFGAACTFANAGWRDRLADLIDGCEGVLTRCDLALDFFDGIPGGLGAVVAQYEAGLCDVGGRRLKCACVGDWHGEKRGRSFYFGSKESGKQTNVYEKGDQLFGIAARSEWLRAELRYGNKLRVLPSDMLRRPSDFFAGASDWHAGMVRLADAVNVAPAPVTCAPRLQLETVEAECVRNVRWMLNTAGPTMAAAINFIRTSDLWSSLEGLGLPGRLKKFKTTEIERGMDAAFLRLTSCGGSGQSFA